MRQHTKMSSLWIVLTDTGTQRREAVAQQSIDNGLRPFMDVRMHVFKYICMFLKDFLVLRALTAAKVASYGRAVDNALFRQV